MSYANGRYDPSEHSDFVIFGVSNPTGVTLLASTKIGAASLETTLHPYPWTKLEVELRAYVVVEAPDYASAFRALFASWNPDTVNRAQLPSGSSGSGPVPERPLRSVTSSDDSPGR